ncbi:MAG TPA: SGNH/GDSL hydrolase family protein [Bryobacteraceae bacterium]|nr:SGNH/GDSL hydrolase family protein [Bryobacteraceae bacterium]
MSRSKLLRLAICAVSAVLISHPLQAASFDRLYVFGDSYSDNGAGYIDGNGPTAVAYLAQRLGFQLKPATSAEAQGESLNFAVSGAGTGNGQGAKRGENAFLGLGMGRQVDDFANRVRSGQIKFKPDTTLFFLAGGLNDRRIPTDETVSNLKGEIRVLYSLGARRFMLALLPTAIPNFSEVGKRLNPALELIPRAMMAELAEAKIHLSRWGVFFDAIMQNPEQYGIRNTTAACAGRAIFQQDTTPCPAPGTYFYYHEGHPSTAVHKAVGEKLYLEVRTFEKEVSGQ